MKEFIEKLIGRLEELGEIERNRPCDCDEDGYGDAEQIYDDGRSQGRFEQTHKIIEIVNQLAEEYNNESVKGDLISRSATIKALKEGVFVPAWNLALAQTIVSKQPTAYNDGWIPCSSGNIPNKDGMYLTTVFDKSTNRRMLRHRKFENGRFVEGGTSRAFPVVAWYYEPLPEPYHPKGE